MQEEEKEINTEKQPKNKVDYILPYMWKKGQSGNPAGRPKGKTMKEYAKEMLACQTEEERQAFLHGLPKEIIWKMAEGNPKQDTELSGTVNVIPILGGITQNGDISKDESIRENIATEETP